MNIAEIIAQEEAAHNAEKKVNLAIKQSKSEILLQFAMKIFDFLELIQNDDKFVFTSVAHPSDSDYTPLFSTTSLTLEYYRGSVTKDINKSAFARMLMRSFSYGRYGSRYLVFRINDEFKPSVGFSNDLSPSEDETYYSAEEAIRVMTKFFLARRKKS